ncbi:ABC transporter substrate-binding protein [Lachnoclostridium sp. Marseille-P6806]|uniref:ABC transporter substrate-binding protein n=1 Tax=Lachnoclostridium sp. Marseille-P6806 TaxID=2364793 RepID=UPI0013EF4ACC|nr:ABC transporter substrate-binding protein [Lachnoclostridium sp. Marseille-P6806]
MFRKAVSILLAAGMTLPLAACGSAAGSGAAQDGQQTEASAGTEETGDSGEYTQITYAFVSFNTIPDDTSAVEEKINEISREKIGVEVHLMPLSIADYTQQVSLAVQNGEVDLFHTLGDLGNDIAQDMCCDITDMIDADAPELRNLIEEDWFKTTSQNGRIYAVPTLKPFALQPMLIYRKDIAEELGLDMDSVKSAEDLTAIFEKVREAHPEMTPLAPVSQGDSGLTRWITNIDWLGDSFSAPTGVLQGDDMTVTSYYDLADFEKYANLVRSWYENDLIMKDAATTTSAAAELMSSGSYFAYSASYSYPLEDTAASLSAPSGYDVGAIALGSAYLDTSAINAVAQVVASTSEHQDAALKFLELTYTDPEVINTMLYGIEGEDYVKNDDGTVSYPEGQDASTVSYTAQLSCGVLGNFFIQWPLQGSGSEESLAWENEQNHKAAKSPAMGFTFDASQVQTQYTAVNNVIKQYLPGIACGSVDPAAALPEFREALRDAGYDDILAAKQTQLDAWLAQQ